MTDMDPITAFSLACGVIQIIDFGFRAVSMCKEMYEQGELSEYKELEVTTKHLANAQNDIRLPSSSLSATAVQKPQDKELSEIAKDCSAIAEELTTKLEALKIHDSRRKRDRIKMGLKASREQRRIQELQRRLDSYRKALDTHILLGLRQQLVLFTDLGPAIQDLSQQVQTIITELSQGPKAFDELANAIRNEHAQTREHITENFLHYQQMQDHKEYRKRLLDSLWFNELWSREERIVDAHRETFEWIFDSTGKGVGRWDNFVEWLECGKGIYWIKGKAGSGKSTLMSFLAQDSRTPKSLKVWAAGKSILMPKFYFWSGGTPVERSTEGLLRSLLWQILNQSPDVQVSDLGPRSSHSIFEEPIAAWTERRLRAKLIETVQRAKKMHHLCLFIDGLDEFAGDQAGLISFIQDTVQSPEIKMCLSSRPDQMFAQAFASSPTLQLQDLTKIDIRRYVMDELQGVPKVSPMASQGPDWLQNLTEQILWKAQGVFLWVSLAVKDQIRGLRNDDSVEQLEERLTYLPDEVEGIYARMLSQIDRPYRQEASIFMQIALHGAGSSLLSHILAFHENLDGILSSDDDMPELELVAMSDRIRKRIVIACAGLLEAKDKDQENSDQENFEQENSEQKNSEQENSEQENSEQENFEQKNSEQENSEQKNSKHKNFEQKNSEQENSKQENSEQENSEHKDFEQENSTQENDLMSRIDPRTKGKAAAPDPGNSDFDDDAVNFSEERSSRSEDKTSILNGEASELDEESSVLDSRDSKVAYPHASQSPGEARGMEISILDRRFDVVFIHRTAVDFMRNEDAGGAFLRHNTPSGFDARVFHVKVLLAKLRLFGYDHGRGAARIMKAIWVAEHGTGHEQTILCQLMDGIMWRIDQKYYLKERDRSSHWSTRWRISRTFDYAKHISELKRLGIPFYTSSRSRNLGGQNMGISPEWDFLLLAALYGLHRYVQQNLKYGSFMCDRDATAYLLYSSMLPLSTAEYADRLETDRIMSSLDFTNGILNRDVDPNYKVNDDLTLWSAHLLGMHNVLRSWFWLRTDEELDNVQNAFANTAILFIDRGADLAVKETLKLNIILWMYQHIGYVVWLDLSVLGVLESCLMGQRELFRIKEACKCAGAFSYARCSMLQVVGIEDRKTLEEYELSNLESDALLPLYYRDFTTYEMRSSTSREMEKLLDEIREERKQGRNDEPTLGEADIDSTEEHSSDCGTTDETGREADF